MFCKRVRALLSDRGVATIRELIGVGLGASVAAAGGCATHVTFRDHSHPAGAAGMAGFTSSGGAGTGTGGRGGAYSDVIRSPFREHSIRIPKASDQGSGGIRS